MDKKIKITLDGRMEKIPGSDKGRLRLGWSVNSESGAIEKIIYEIHKLEEGKIAQKFAAPREIRLPSKSRWHLRNDKEIVHIVELTDKYRYQYMLTVETESGESMTEDMMVLFEPEIPEDEEAPKGKFEKLEVTATIKEQQDRIRLRDDRIVTFTITAETKESPIRKIEFEVNDGHGIADRYIYQPFHYGWHNRYKVTEKYTHKFPAPLVDRDFKMILVGSTKDGAEYETEAVFTLNKQEAVVRMSTHPQKVVPVTPLPVKVETGS